MSSLSKRIARHKKKIKKKRWHIDYLTSEADETRPIPIISSNGRELECLLSSSLEKIADYTVTGFGSSDCKCPGHLFYFSQNPMHNPGFIDLIQHYRIEQLEEKLD